VKTPLDRLAMGETLCGDGAWGTQLMARGLSPGGCPESMTLDKPGVLAEIAALYVDAGADLVTTNTFGASPLKLASHGLDDRTEEINRRAVEVLAPVTEGRAFISASVGPTGKILEPYGDAPLEVIAEAFRRPVIATMTFDSTPRGFFTTMGTTVEQACKVLIGAGADIIGSNCGNGIDTMIEIARDFKREASVPVIIQSNAGLPENRGSELVYPESPEYMAERVAQLMDLGVAIIGGCCGTGPEHIRAIRAAIEANRGE
jgi:5-methyltetrahydrofolate--homocysteine methyltransferase